MHVIGLSSWRKCFILSLSMILVICSVSAQSTSDSLARAKRNKEIGEKAAITEIYSPVPPIVTPGKTDAEPPSDALFYSTERIWIYGVLKDLIQRRQRAGKYMTTS